MKLSRPVINTIRFDTNLALVGNRKGVETRMECDGYCVDGIDETIKKYLLLG